MENKVEHLDDLKAEVLQCFGEELRTAAAFEKLSSVIQQKTGCRLSVYTLKRLFGYVKNDGSPSINTLSILSRYAGYPSWSDFVTKCHPPIESDTGASSKRRYRYIVGTASALIILLGVGLLLSLLIKGNSPTNPHEVTGTLFTEGDTLTWTLDKDTWSLTVTGRGRMCNFQDDDLPEAWLAYRDSLRSVVVSEGVTYLGDYAFSYCSNLMDVTLPTSLKAIGNGTFKRCVSLTSLILPDGLESLGSAAFRGCRCLQEIVVPRGITELRFDLFAQCYDLKSCTLLGPVTYMDRYVFARCYSLQHIDLPASLVVIGNSCFADCSSLEEVVLPEGLTLLSDNAFRQCTSLKRVVLPSTLNAIGRNAFGYCSHLALVECQAQRAPQVGEDVFVGIPSSVRLICPKDADYTSWNQVLTQQK